MKFLSGKSNIFLSGWLVILSFATFVLLGRLNASHEPTLASVMILTSAVLVFYKKSLSMLPYGFAVILIVVASISIMPDLDSSEVTNNCNGCYELGSFFRAIAYLVYYGGSIFGFLLLLVPFGPMSQLEKPTIASTHIEPVEHRIQETGTNSIARVVKSDTIKKDTERADNA